MRSRLGLRLLGKLRVMLYEALQCVSAFSSVSNCKLYMIDEHICFYFTQGLAQEEVAVCLSVVDNFRMSGRSLEKVTQKLADILPWTL